MAHKIRALMIVACISVIALTTTDANAAFPFRRLQLDLPRPASEMQEGSEMLSPIAYVRFCLNNASECEKPTNHDRIALTVDSWMTMRQVNADVNGRITPDASKGGFDWSVTTNYGNCNDYAVQKRKELVEKGFSASALSLSVVVTPWGEGHLVLTARTDRGDFVLDNLRPTILPWDHTGYAFNRVQSIDDPETWVHPEHHHRYSTPRRDDDLESDDPAKADL